MREARQASIRPMSGPCIHVLTQRVACASRQQQTLSERLCLCLCLFPLLFSKCHFFHQNCQNIFFSRSFMGASKRDVDMTGSIILTVSTAPQNVASARTACPPPSSPDVAQLRGEGGTQRAILAPIYIYIQTQRAFCPSMRWSRHSSRSRAAWLSHAAMSTHAREDEREEDEGRGSD